MNDDTQARDDEDRIGRLLDLAERNHRLLVALARDNGLDANGDPITASKSDRSPTDRDIFFSSIEVERDRQDEKFPGQRLPFVRVLGVHPGEGMSTSTKKHLKYAVERAKTRCESRYAAGTLDWRIVLEEEIAEFFYALVDGDPDSAFAEGVQVCAVVLRILESHEFKAIASTQ